MGCNEDLAEALGLEPAGGYTWKELLAKARKLRKSKGKKREELGQALGFVAGHYSHTWEELLESVQKLVATRDALVQEFDVDGVWKPGVDQLRDKLRIADKSVGWFTCLDQVRTEHNALAAISCAARTALGQK